MKKAVAIVSQDPKLEEMVKALDEIDQHFEQRKEFILKQYEAHKKERTAQADPILKNIKDHLKDRGLLPGDFNDEKHHLHLDSEVGAVMVCDGDHSGHPMLRMLAQMGVVPEGVEPEDLH